MRQEALTTTLPPPAPAAAPRSEADLLRAMEAELRAQAAAGVLAQHRRADLGTKWNGLVGREPQRFITDDLTLRPEVLREFRRRQVFVSDYGNLSLSPWRPQTWCLGSRRGARRRLLECYETLSRLGELELLRRHPCSDIGRPHVFRHRGCRYTYRWHKHIHFLSLFRRWLGERLPAEFTALDIGSSYGIFSGLLRSEYPRSRHVLIDFPEQLLLARYFLGRWHPGARIAGVRELRAHARLRPEDLAGYDFILLPCEWYARLEPGTAQVVTNFASLGEMPRRWFEHYLGAPAFSGSQFFFTVNRIQSAPTFDNDLTILDYPIWDRRKRLHFGVSPVFSHTYVRRRLVGYERLTYASQYFEYLGAVGDG